MGAPVVGMGSTGPTPVVGERSVDTAITENILGRGFGNGESRKKRRRKRKMANFAGYRDPYSYTKTPETTGVQPRGGRHLTQQST